MTGDAQMYKEENKKVPTTGGIIVIKSLVWPGAYVIYQNERWFTFYAGYGHKADQQDYYPVHPPLPQFEPEDTAEQAEPNPKEAPKEEGAAMSPAEMIEALNAVLTSPEKFAELVDKTFEMIDTNKSGQIDPKELDHFLKEFVKALGLRAEPDPDNVDKFFKEFDQNKNGEISKEELEKALQMLMQAWKAMVDMGMVPTSPEKKEDSQEDS